KVVPIARIVGSEGRYRDFNKAFLPKHDHIKLRWVNVDKAYLTDIILPPIQIYEIGGVYFVRDGNHRVSVARSQGKKYIDAEVTDLRAEIKIEPGMTKQELREAVIKYEQDKFYKETGLTDIIPREELIFSATGRYEEIRHHINGHKYFLNENIKTEIAFKKAAESWYLKVFKPIFDTITENNLVSRFPGRTRADLYVWIVKHWDELKRKYGDGVPIHKAAWDFSEKYGKGFWQRFKERFRKII
ncbi:MAG: transcriptional regulator, partial [Spirochaetota bacterium]